MPSVEIEYDNLAQLLAEPHTGLFGSHADLTMTASFLASAWSNYIRLPACWGWIGENFFPPLERATKDGPAIIWAALEGGRYNINVVSVSAFAVEIDGRATVDEACALVEASGLEAVLHTTHSHWRTSQDVTLGTYQKAMGKGPPTTDSVRAFCAAHPRYSHLTGVALLNDGAVRRKKEYGQWIDKLDIGHDPETKLRIIFPLACPVPVRGEIGIDGFKRLYHLHASRVLGNRYSTESANAGRIHYLPAHRPGAPYDVRHFQGRLTDWRADWAAMQVPLVEERKVAEERRVERAKLPPTGLDQLEHPLKSIPPDCTFDDWLGCLMAIHYETRGSDEGAALAHAWSEGDPRYRHEQVQSIWDSFDVDHPRPRAMGSLIELARKYDKDFRPQRIIQLHPSIREWAAKNRNVS